jgi:YbbR domain-containing protein
MQTLKEFLTRNWIAKLFSVVLATLLWLTISTQANSEIGIVIPLEYRNIPAQLEVIGDTTNSVEVRLRGPSRLIREISPSDISATVDLGGQHAGERIVNLTPQNVKAPFGVDIVRVSPSQVKLNLEHTLIKTVPVEVRIEGEPDPAYAIEKVTVTPQDVEIEGPESKVRSLESVPTAAIKVTGMKSSFSGPVDLDLPDPMLRLQYLSPVQVNIEIKERGTQP